MPVGYALVRKPLLAHFVLLLVATAVPLPYGPREEMMELVTTAASLLAIAEVVKAAAVSVTVTVERATVTVTAPQAAVSEALPEPLPEPLPDPLPEPLPDPLPDPEPAKPVVTALFSEATLVEADMTVMYLVEVDVPEIVVVPPFSDPEDPDSPFAPVSPAEAADEDLVTYWVKYSVEVEVWEMVVVITVVDEPLPRVYVRTVSLPVPTGERVEVGAGVLEAEELPPSAAALDVGVTLAIDSDPVPTAAADEAALERAADLADSVAVTGQTVVVRAIVSVTVDIDRAGQSVTVAAQLVMVRMEVV